MQGNRGEFGRGEGLDFEEECSARQAGETESVITEETRRGGGGGVGVGVGVGGGVGGGGTVGA